MPKTNELHAESVVCGYQYVYAWSDRNLMPRLRSITNMTATDWRHGNHKSRQVSIIQSKLTDSRDKNTVKAYNLANSSSLSNNSTSLIQKPRVSK